MFFRQKDPDRLPSSEPVREISREEYSGEWYVIDYTPEQYQIFRTRQRLAGILSLILLFSIGLTPARGMNAIYAALPYALVYVSVILLLRRTFRLPEKPEPMTYDEHRTDFKKPLLIALANLILVILALAGDIAATFLYGLGFSVWSLLQVALYLILLLCAILLYKDRKEMPVTVTLEKPSPKEGGA